MDAEFKYIFLRLTYFKKNIKISVKLLTFSDW